MARALIGEASFSASIQRLCNKIDSVELMDFFRAEELDHSLLVKLKLMFLFLDAVLDDVEEEQIEKPRVGKWLHELKHAVFDAEDLLHDIDTEVSRSKVEAEFSTEKTQVGNFLSICLNPFYQGMNGRIQELLERLENLAFAQQKDVLGLRVDFGGKFSLRSLQDLSLSGCENVTELPNSIGNLISLRYIDLSYTGIRRLPDIICTLYNLQTLLLSHCSSLIELPADMDKLINLRHLDISGTNIKDIPLWMGRLTNLRSLSTFVERPASSFPFGVDCGSGSSPDNEIYELRHKKKAASAEWPFLLISLCLEILSVAFDQASSPSKPHYALFGMLLAIVGVLIAALEFIFKGIKGRVVLRRWGKLWWFYYPPPPCYKLFGTVIEIYGLVGGIAQCVSSIIQYVYFSQHLDSPFKVSLLPAILVICLITSRLSKDRMRIRDGAGGKSL